MDNKRVPNKIKKKTSAINRKRGRGDNCLRKIKNSDQASNTMRFISRQAQRKVLRSCSTDLCEFSIVKYRQVSNELSWHTLRKLLARVPSLLPIVLAIAPERR